jgi:hypothetical protein
MPGYAYHLLLGLLYLPIVTLGSLLNLFMLLIIITTPKLRHDPRNVFILTLAVSDFFLCNFTSPLTLWDQMLQNFFPCHWCTRVMVKVQLTG